MKPIPTTKRTFGQFTISHPKKVAKATTESWWLRPEFQGARAAFQQHAVELHPGGMRSREVVPRHGARGSAKGF